MLGLADDMMIKCTFHIGGIVLKWTSIESSSPLSFYDVTFGLPHKDHAENLQNSVLCD